MNLPTATRRLGTGQVTVAGDGLVDFASRPSRAGFLLQETSDTWHSAEHRWGTGFVITDQGFGRWQAPDQTLWRHDQALASYSPTTEIDLTVQRLGETFMELSLAKRVPAGGDHTQPWRQYTVAGRLQLGGRRSHRRCSRSRLLRRS